MRRAGSITTAFACTTFAQWTADRTRRAAKRNKSLSGRFDGTKAIHATVAWVEPPRAGLRFENAIHVPVFDVVMRALSRGSTS